MTAEIPAYEMPDLQPDGKRVAHGEQEFISACMTHIHRNPATRDLKLGHSILTRSKKWGLVLRIDFKIPGRDVVPFVNRIICWQTAKPIMLHVQFAIGQSVPPLG